MLSTHIRHAWRILKKDSLHTGINILGLSLSLGAFMLIVMYLTHEYSFDRFHANAQRIYQVGNWRTERFRVCVTECTY
jgi:putative ABC transport system permease protein